MRSRSVRGRRRGARPACASLLLVLSILAGRPALGRPAPALTVPVTVVNYAGLPAAQLDATLSTIERLLGEAGLRLRWARCAPARSGLAAACSAPPEGGAFVLRLLTSAPAPVSTGRAARLGFAALDDRGRGVIATVYVDRVGRLGRTSAVSPPWLVGLVASHELAHLLLGTAEHATRGVMQAGWSSTDLRRTAPATWRFTPGEASRLRRAAAERAITETGTPAVPLP